MPPGSAVLSIEANTGVGVLMRTCAAVLASLGHQLPDRPSASISDDAGHIREDFLQSHQRVDALMEPLRLKYNLNALEMARAGAVATALAIHGVRGKVPPDRGFGIASFAFTEGAKTVPPIAEQGASR